MLQKLRELNKHIFIHSIYDDAFSDYGAILSGYDASPCLSVMEHREIPPTGNIYVANDPELMETSLAKELSDIYYGSMPIQMGYCNGNSSRLNALEYHKCSEIDLAVTDLVLLLADIREIRQGRLSSDSVKAFYVPAGCGCELYATTLHFAPCRVSDAGFKSVIVLPEHTNEPLSELPAPKSPSDQFLWMRNKWLIAHPASPQAAKGAYTGIFGNNIEIFY